MHAKEGISLAFISMTPVIFFSFSKERWNGFLDISDTKALLKPSWTPWETGNLNHSITITTIALTTRYLKKTLWIDIKIWYLESYKTRMSFHTQMATAAASVVVQVSVWSGLVLIWLRSEIVDLLKYRVIKSSEAFKMKLCSYKLNVVLTGTIISAINRTSLRLPSHNPGDIHVVGPSLRLWLPAIPECYTWVSLMYERGELGEKNSSLGFCVYKITSGKSSEKGF